MAVVNDTLEVNSQGYLSDSITIDQQTGTQLLFDTAGKYIPNSIELNVSVQEAITTISGGALSGTATASANNSSCTLSNTNTSGVSFTTACTPTRTAVTCSTSTAGWVEGTVNTLAANSSTAMTPTTYYITGVHLVAPTAGSTNVFTVTVPNGNSTQTITFNVDSSGNVTIT